MFTSSRLENASLRKWGVAVIVQCPSCKSLVDVVEAQVVLDEVRLRCSACGKDAVLPTASSSTVSSPTEATEPSAKAQTPAVDDSDPSADEETPQPQPKSQPQPQAVVADVDADRGDTNAPAQASVVDDDLREAVEAVLVDDSGKELADEFIALLPHWHDAERHAKLIQKAAIMGQLPVVGLRYKAVLDVRPDDARAKAGQDQILTQAMLRMGSMSAANKTPGENRIKRWTQAAMVLLTVVVCGAIWYMVLVMRSM